MLLKALEEAKDESKEEQEEIELEVSKVEEVSEEEERKEAKEEEKEEEGKDYWTYTRYNPEFEGDESKGLVYGSYSMRIDAEGQYNFSVFRPNFNSVLGYLHPCVDQSTGLVKYANVSVQDQSEIGSHLLGYHEINTNRIGLQQQYGDITGAQIGAVYNHEQHHWDWPGKVEYQVRKDTNT